VRDRRKSLTASPAQIKTPTHHQHSKARSIRRSCVFSRRHGVAKLFGKAFGSSMHFSFYLVIAALVVLGAEVAYALYQLVNLTL
jgi:hypothetical protein